MPRDFLLRSTIAGPADYLGRDVTATLDYMDRELVLVWAATTEYVVGDYVELSTGEVLQATVAGTSAAAEPTAPDYGETVVDGDVTWEQVTTA